MPAHNAARASAARDKNFIAVFPSQYGTLRALEGSLAQAIPPEQVEFAAARGAV